MAEVLDYSGGWPRPSEVIRMGFAGVVRYVGTPGRRKNITPEEAAAFRQAGVPVALVYEDTAGWMQGGTRAGVAAARAVEADAARCRIDLRCCYLASDQDVVTVSQMNTVMDCLDGASTVWGRGVTGTYGGLSVVDTAIRGGHATWGWQTVAWSGGRVSTLAHIYQHAGYVSVDGVQCDRSTVLRTDWGQTPRSDGAPATEETDVPLTDEDVSKIVNTLIPAMVASALFRLAIRGEVIIALTDPGHQYLQDDIQLADKPIADQVALVQRLATSIQTSQGSVMEKINSMGGGSGVNADLLVDKIVQTIGQRLTVPTSKG